MDSLATTSPSPDLVVAELVDQRLHEVLHEIRQPLAAVFALAESVRTMPGISQDTRQAVELLIEQAREVAAAATSAIQGDLGEAPDEPGTTDLREVVDSVLRSVALTWGGRLRREVPLQPAVVLSDRHSLRRCVTNLVDNAVRAAGRGGEVRVTVEPAQGTVRLFVDDDGPGFGNITCGSGLGLHLARGGVERFGGRLSVAARPASAGTRVIVLLRAADDVAGPDGRPAVPAEPADC